MSNRARFLGLSLLLPVAIAGLNVASAAAPTAAAVTAERMLKGTDLPNQWPSYGGSYNEQRFSPLKKINDTNVKDLGLAWYGDYDTNQNQHGSPIYADGVIYVSTARNFLHAFDARNGKRLWTYAPAQVPHSNLGMANKGIAMWNGKIYMGLLNGHLVAVDARNGKLVWETDTVPRSLVGDMTEKYALSMPPRVAKGKVFIGASGGEYGVRGFVGAYDAETGKEVWRFWTVPGDPAKPEPEQKHLVAARKTWPDRIEYWKQGGGGAVWDAMVYDPVTDLLYFGTGNGTPWNREMRDPNDGDNLYVASLVAVKPDTGEYVWHYQETPGDSWDYDAISPLVTADLTIGGQKKHVIIQPSKNGFLYVLNAADGKLLSADAFTPVTWASGVDLKTGRPIEVPGARYETTGFNVGPGAPGGHTWHPNAFSPVTGLIYIPTWENYSAMGPQPRPANGIAPLVHVGGNIGDKAALKPHNKTSNDGWLQAWDPVARKVVWETPRGPRATSGVLATGGNLVFMGNSGGKQIAAYNAKTGAKLWEYNVQTDVYAAPITYELDGVQYIAASVGGSATGDYFAPSYARMVVFKVGGKVKLPPNAPYTSRTLNPPVVTASPAVIAHGAVVYADNCALCHGPNAVPGGRGASAPNLTTSPLLHVQQGFDQVVLQGGRVDRGMMSFAGKLTAADSAAALAYIASRANELKNSPVVPNAAGTAR